MMYVVNKIASKNGFKMYFKIFNLCFLTKE